MKKLILFGITLLAYSAAVAQNQAILNQIGTQQTSTQNQAGSALVSSVIQGSGTGVTTNNTALTDQIGIHHIAEIIQSANAIGNLAQIRQGTVASPGSGNDAIITQQNVSLSNEALITQLGNDNTAAVHQTNSSRNNMAFIHQSGGGQTGQIYQNNSVANSEAFIGQYGTSNTALIQQTNQSSGIAKISQNVQTGFGSGNLASVYQGSDEYGLSGGNYTFVTQENSNNVSRNEQVGMNNVAVINQTGNGNSLSGLGSDPIARQIGSANQLYVTQSGGNMAHVSQVGSGNLAIINQVKN